MSYLKLGYYCLKNKLRGMPYPFAASIDVTCKCNLACEHCYFLEQHHLQELSDTQLLERLKALKQEYPSIIHATWVGGEPLLRKDILEICLDYFPFNMVVTNGTIELPSWRKCVFNVSVDGTKEYYKEIRGLDIYDQVKEHANRKDVRVNIACVLSRKNRHCIEDLLAEWKQTNIGGINFDFYTPIQGKDEDLWLDWQERDEVIEQLLKLKKKYKQFILNSEPVLRSMRSVSSAAITAKCPVPEAVVCLDPMGNRKFPCVIGPKADCARCGCIVPFQIESIVTRKQLASLAVTKRLFT